MAETLRLEELSLGLAGPRLSTLPADVLRSVRDQLDGSVLDNCALAQSCVAARAVYHPPAPPVLPVEPAQTAESTTHGPPDTPAPTPSIGDRAEITTDEGLNEEKRWRSLLHDYGLGRPLSRFVGKGKAMRAIDLGGLSWRQIACGLAHHARCCDVKACRLSLEHKVGDGKAPKGFFKPVNRLKRVRLPLFTRLDYAMIELPSKALIDHITFASTFATGQADVELQLDCDIADAVKSVRNDSGVVILDHVNIVARCLVPQRKAFTRDSEGWIFLKEMGSTTINVDLDWEDADGGARELSLDVDTLVEDAAEDLREMLEEQAEETWDRY